VSEPGLLKHQAFPTVKNYGLSPVTPDTRGSGGAERMIVKNNRALEGGEEGPEVVAQAAEDLRHHVEVLQGFGQDPGQSGQHHLVQLFL
jgi:hypothetical protein